MTISPPHISPIAMQKILIILGELPTEHGSAAGNAVGFGQNRLIFSNPIEDQRSCIAIRGIGPDKSSIRDIFAPMGMNAWHTKRIVGIFRRVRRQFRTPQKRGLLLVVVGRRCNISEIDLREQARVIGYDPIHSDHVSIRTAPGDEPTFVVVRIKANVLQCLFLIVDTLDRQRTLSRFVQGGKQHRGKNSDNSDNDEKFDKSECMFHFSFLRGEMLSLKYSNCTFPEMLPDASPIRQNGDGRPGFDGTGPQPAIFPSIHNPPKPLSGSKIARNVCIAVEGPGSVTAFPHGSRIRPNPVQKTNS